MMKWLFKLLPESWVEGLVRKSAGALVSKGLAIVAGVMLTHGASEAQAAKWQSATQDVVVTMAVAWVSNELTKLRGEVKVADLASAHANPPDAPLYIPPAKVQIATPPTLPPFQGDKNVGAGNTTIGRSAN